MAALSNAVRQQLWRGLMRFWSARLEAVSGLTKTDLQAAVNAADDWAEANALLYNTALLLAFRTNATSAQKAVVVLARYDVTSLRAILGEVD